MNAVLLDLTLRGSAALLIVWAVDALLASRMQARWRRLWWLLVPIVFLMPWKAAVLPFQAPGPAEILAPMLSIPSIPSKPAPDFPPVHISSPSLGDIARLIWLIGGAGSVGVLIVRTMRASRRWAGLRFSTEPRLLGILEDCKVLARVTAPIGLVVAREVDAPVIVGWLRPRILLPESFATAASEERLRHVILHELAHFRFMDVPAGWLFALARCVHWFNPFAHLAASRWAGFREEAADESAIRWSRQSAPTEYGETLLSFVRDEPGAPSVGVLAIGETFSNLKHRIHMITRHAQRNPKPVLALALALAVAAIATLRAQPTAAAANPAPSADSKEPAKAAAVTAMDAWLKGIDAGNYAASWDQAAASFQKALTSEKWVAALDAVRKPLGALESRKLASALYQSDIPLPDGKTLKGDFVIAQFETSFANLKFAIETVTFEKQDGAWKASGYFIKPR